MRSAVKSQAWLPFFLTWKSNKALHLERTYGIKIRNYEFGKSTGFFAPSQV